MTDKLIKIEALTTITSAAGDIIPGKDGELTTAQLTLQTEHGPIRMSLTDFNNLYIGMVNCWPSIRSVKDQIIATNKEETTAAKLREREAAEAAKKAEREAAKKARDEARTAAKKLKEEEAAKKKADREAALKKAAEDKRKADMEKAKKAAADKAKKDAEKSKGAVKPAAKAEKTKAAK